MLSSSSEYLFVYGSLKRSFKHAIHQHLVMYANFVDEGQFQGKLYQIDWYPGVMESPNPNDRVSGEVFRVNAPNILLPLLDQFEGYDPMRHGKGEYIRCIRPILTRDKVTLSCQIYLYNWPIKEAKLIPSGVF